MWLSYPLSYSLTGSSASSASTTRLLISLSSSCTTANIRSVITTPILDALPR